MEYSKIDELERLAKAATPGPWKAWIMKTPLYHAIMPEDFPHRPTIGQTKSDTDAAYIVAACNAVPELIERVRELEWQDANSMALQCVIVELEDRFYKLEAENADLRRELKAALERS